MEQFVLGIFQEQLSKYIVGFRKEQVNANLLNGKGEISNVELNCANLNEHLSEMTPYLELERVHVSKLSFHVSSWTNLRRAPIVVDLEHMTARAVEPLHYNSKSRRRQFRQLTKEQLAELILKGLLPPKRTNSYNLFDRIVDNLTIEITSIRLEYQPTGKFKTRRPGPWTPPEIQVQLAHLRLVSVNEFGQEASPDEIWRNHHHRDRTVMIYKRISMEYQLLLKPLDGEPVPLVTGRDNLVQVQIAYQRQARDGEFAAIQLDITAPHVEIDIPDHVVPLLAHALAAVTFCLAKDRAFVDPLKSQHDHEVVAEPAPTTASESNVHPEDFPADSSSSSSDEEEENNNHETEASAPACDAPPEGRTVLLLPNGLIIYDKLSVSLSIHKAVLRGTYASSGFVEIEARGCVSEVIWPHFDQAKGGYVQASLSYVSIHETHESRRRPLFLGGGQYNERQRGLEEPAVPLSQVGRDETFPLFEARPVRPDPTGLRHTFPAQAVGLKTTVEFLENDEIRFVNEVGTDKLDVVADMHAWSRIVRFALHVERGGFDPRWYSGDWGRLLTTDILLRPSEQLVLEDCLQPTKQLFLDGNSFISSDLFNVTARISNTFVRVPAAIEQDLRSCNVAVQLDELMLVVSSALPRTFLSGRIGSGVNGDDSAQKGVIDFPNDPSDVVYDLEQSEDPSDRQRGVTTSRPISTFRAQLTLRGYSVRLEPVVPFGTADKPRQLLAPSELTMLVCFEGEPPTSPTDNLVKMVLFVSVLVHRLQLNLDLDLLSSALGSISYHAAAGKQIAEMLPSTQADDAADSSASTTECTVDSDCPLEARVPRSFRGRRTLVRRHLYRSRETGGFSLAMALQVAESSFRLWRQDVPARSSVRSNDGNIPLQVLKVFASEVVGLEVGIEIRTQKLERVVVAKLCLSSMTLRACGYVSPDSMSEHNAPVELVEVYRLTSNTGKTATNPFSGDAVALRVEEQRDSMRSWAISGRVAHGVASCHLAELEATVVMVVEALLMPTSACNFLSCNKLPGLFPEGTVGGLLRSFLPVAHSADFDLLDDIASIVPELVEVLKDGKGSGLLIHRFIGILIPDDVKLVIAGFTVSNVMVEIPGPQHDSGGIASLLHEADFIACYLPEQCEGCKLLDVIGRKGRTWRALLPCLSEGLWHGLECRQSVMLTHSFDILGKPMEPTYLVNNFVSGYIFEKSNLTLSMPDGPSIQNVEKLEDFLFLALDFASRCKGVARNMSRLLSVLKPSHTNDTENRSNGSCGDDNPISLACSGTTTLIQSLVDYVRELADNSIEHGSFLQRQLEERDNQIRALKALVFCKERERLAAITLVSAQISGWLRWGSAQRTGQRGLHTCNLWPHWLVLRRCVLVIYSSPGSYDPVGIIPLAGASLKELAGGRRKRDIKRSFAIVDRAGTYYFLLAESDREYCDWVQELHTAIRACTPLSDHREEDALPTASEDAFITQDSMDDAIASNQLNNTGRLSRVVHAARTKGRAVVSRGRKRNDEHSDPDSFSMESVSRVASDDFDGASINSEGEFGAMKDQPLRSRFAGVGQVTKGRLGSAFQAARQKRRELADRARRPRGTTTAIDSWSTDSADSTPVSRMGSTASGDTSIDGAQTGPRCRACTFINAVGAVNCEMCNSPLDVVATVAVIEEATGSSIDTFSDGAPFSQFLKESETEEGGSRPGIRERLGTAVRSVRKGAATLPDDETGSSVESGKTRSIFRPRSLQGGQDTGENSVGSGAEVIKLKNIRITGSLATETDPFGKPQIATIQPLKQIEANLFVEVTVRNKDTASRNQMRDSAKGEQVQTEDSTNVGFQFRSDEAVHEAPATDRAHSKRKAGDQPDSAAIEVEAEQLPRFQLQVFRQGLEGSEVELIAEIEKDIVSLLSLHTAISECVAQLPFSAYCDYYPSRTTSSDMSNSLASTLGLNAVETTRITGRILGGLMAESLRDESKLLSSQTCGAISEFLNSMLECPLPVDALAYLSNFLALSRLDTRSLRSETTAPEPPVSTSISSTSSTCSKIGELASACQVQIQRVENQNFLAQRLAETSFPNTRAADDSSTQLSPLLAASVHSSTYQEAMHVALMRAMEERDEAQARMVAAEVLHVHEMDQQRKKTAHFAAQMEAEKATSQDDKSFDKAKAMTTRISQQMQQNSDAELLALCQQLAGEISGRTEAALEVSRLKETRQIERDCEIREKKALLQEIDHLKQLLAQEQQKTESAQEASGNWKKSFQEAVQAQEQLHPVGHEPQEEE